MTLSRLIPAAILSLTLTSGAAFAHTAVKTSSIEDAAVLDTLPETFSFSFSQPVGLIAFAIRTSNGEAIELGFKPPKAPADTFTVTLPDLAPGAYTIEWRTMSKDGHVMTGKSAFELK